MDELCYLEGQQNTKEGQQINKYYIIYLKTERGKTT